MDRHESVKRLNQLGSRYPLQVARLRVGIGIWLLLLTAVFYRTGHAGQWAWLLGVVAAVHFCLAYRLFRTAPNGFARRSSH